MAINNKGDIIAIGAPNRNHKTGSVSIYKYRHDDFNIIQELTDMSNINIDKYYIHGFIEKNDNTINEGYGRT